MSGQSVVKEQSERTKLDERPRLGELTKLTDRTKNGRWTMPHQWLDNCELSNDT